VPRNQLGSEAHDKRYPMRVRAESRRNERLIYGKWPVLEALRSGARVSQVIVAGEITHATGLHDILVAASSRQIEPRSMPRAELDVLTSGGAHQGVAAILEPPTFLEPDAILERARVKHEAPLVIALDSVQDPRNAGSLLRTAEITGTHGVVVQERRSAGFGPGLEKSSAGALAYLAVALVTNLDRSLRWFQDQGLWIMGLDASGTERYDQVDYARPLVIVVGNEGSGLRRLTRERCDVLVTIPMRGRLASLNVATAGSLVLYEAWRQRGFLP
jgi:23S rRNA (guanosine2251-2'-O)-methyltransferase